MNKKRKNRIVCWHFGNTIEEYKKYFNDRKNFLNKIKLIDELNFGALGSEHKPNCPRNHHFTIVKVRKRNFIMNNKKYKLKIRTVCCKDCGVTFTILPDFIIPYKRKYIPPILIKNVKLNAEMLDVYLSDGRIINVPIKKYTRLRNATKEEINNWELIGGGVGVHWEDIDEDLSLEGFLRI